VDYRDDQLDVVDDGDGLRVVDLDDLRDLDDDWSQLRGREPRRRGERVQYR
jgi:hypothetical protein